MGGLNHFSVWNCWCVNCAGVTDYWTQSVCCLKSVHTPLSALSIQVNGIVCYKDGHHHHHHHHHLVCGALTCGPQRGMLWLQRSARRQWCRHWPCTTTSGLSCCPPNVPPSTTRVSSDVNVRVSSLPLAFILFLSLSLPAYDLNIFPIVSLSSYLFICVPVRLSAYLFFCLLTCLFSFLFVNHGQETGLIICNWHPLRKSFITLHRWVNRWRTLPPCLMSGSVPIKSSCSIMVVRWILDLHSGCQLQMINPVSL